MQFLPFIDEILWPKDRVRDGQSELQRSSASRNLFATMLCCHPISTLYKTFIFFCIIPWNCNFTMVGVRRGNFLPWSIQIFYINCKISLPKIKVKIWEKIMAWRFLRTNILPKLQCIYISWSQWKGYLQKSKGNILIGRYIKVKLKIS